MCLYVSTFAQRSTNASQEESISHLSVIYHAHQRYILLVYPRPTFFLFLFFMCLYLSPLAERSTNTSQEAPTGWRRIIGCLSVQVISRKRALQFEALLRKMTCDLRHSMSRRLARSLCRDTGVVMSLCRVVRTKAMSS